jgi:glutamate-ammonia-ligase adenylyltransferase
LEDIQSLFTPEQLKEAADVFPAVKRYLKLIEDNPNSQHFKIRRHKAWLKLALHSYFNSQSQKKALKDWSQFVRKEVQDHLEQSKPNNLSLFALGKLGSDELNLSSDIDVIFVGDNNLENEKIVKKFIADFNLRDEYGFFTRVDLDIRPGGNHSPIIQSLEQVENYYYYHGETWERLALVRLSPIYANSNTTSAMGELRAKFCFRRHIDFNTYDEFSRLRTKIHFEVKRKRSSNKIDLKLFPGFIRDIELFTHSLCLIHAGRSPELDTAETDLALEKLAIFEIISEEHADFLIEHYWKLRRLENLVQAREDAQTHSINEDDIFIPLVYGSIEEWQNARDECHRIVSGFLKILDQHFEQLPDAMEDQKSLLIQLGFSNDSIEQAWPKLIKSTVRSRFSEKDELIRKQVIMQFLNEISDHATDKDLALNILGDFFRSVRAKASLFRFFQVHPEVLEDLSYLFGISPSLSSKLCNRPELIDNFVYRAQASPPEQLDELLDFLTDHKQLGHILYSLDYVKDHNIFKFTNNISELANFIFRALLLRCCDDEKLNIIKMGKWGGNELGIQSDLDFIFVYQSPNIPEHVHKAIRKFLSLIQANYRAGRLYEIDLRLRPSGNSGPLLVSYPKLKNYLKDKAAVWEKQAYLKASFLNAREEKLSECFIEQGLTEEDKVELKEIRSKLIQRTTNKDSINIKYAPGGLVDIELHAQEKILEHRIRCEGSSNFALLERLSLTDAVWDRLRDNYLKLRSMEQALPIFRQRSDVKVYREKQEENTKIFAFAEGINSFDDLNKMLKENTDFLTKLP